jgi:hypothetical protein
VYDDVDLDPEGSSTYRWLRDGAAILGATARSYTLVTDDLNAMIAFEVTPVASSGASPGAPAQSPAIGPVTAAPVSVATISPNTVAAGSAIDVTVTGSGFAPGATLAFENGSGPAPSVSNVAVLDANTITATVTTKRGGPRRDRLWDVRVTNPDGSSATLVGGLTVTSTR